MKRAALLIAALVFAFPAAADAPDEAYLKLVDAAAAKPAEAKWCDIRAIYPDTSFYRVHLGLHIRKQTMEAGQKMLMEKSQASVAAFRDFLRKNAAAVGAHYYAAYLYNWNRDLVKQKMEALLPDFGHGADYIDAAFEKSAAAALLDCILRTGDGRSEKTAYRVVTVDEVEVIIDKYYKVEPVKMDRRQDNGRFYNVITIEIPDSKLRQDLFFQLDDRLVRGAIAAERADKLKPALSPKSP